jgi:hypothetical protein
MKTAVLLLAASLLFAADPVREERVQFAKGASSATKSGVIKGYASVKYKLAASAGQQMEVTLKPSNRSNYFNIMAPGADSALFLGDTSGNHFSGKLEKSGDYVIDVYLMRNAARRNETSRYTITFKVTGAGAASPSAAATWPAKYNASGSVKCSSGSAALDRMCEFRVVRNGASGADVWVVNADASSPVKHRLLRLTNKVFTTNDGSKLPSERKADNWLVTAGQERYFIPDAAIFGG